MRNVKYWLLLILFAFTIASCKPNTNQIDNTELAGNNTSNTVRIGLLPYSSYAPLYFAIAEGYFEEQGLEIEVVDFRTQIDAVVALASKQIDVTGGLIDVATLAANAEGAGIKIVADKGFNDPNAGCAYSAWMATNDLLASGELDDLHNMAGKKVILVKAGYLEFVMDSLLAPVGLSTSDLEIMEVPIPSRGEVLESGGVDIALLGEPWISRVLDSGKVGVWKSFEQILPNEQLGVLWYGPTLTEERPDVGNRFMVAYLKAVRQYNEGKTERNIALMAEFTNSTIEEAQSTCWQVLEPNGNMNIETVLKFQQWANDKGYLEYTLTEDEIWDNRFLEYAQNHIDD